MASRRSLAAMNRYALDIWVCQSNIQRFQFMMRTSGEEGGRKLLGDLLAQQETTLRELNHAQKRRWRLVQPSGAGSARAVIESLLDESIEVMGADMGNIQVVDPRSGALRCVVSRGLPQPLLSILDTESLADNSECDRAMIAAGALSAKSIPLAGQDQQVLGMLSLHWRSVTHPTPEQTEQVEMLIRRAMTRLP